jgi:hypothetical protein
LKKFLTPALAVCLFLLIVGAKWGTFDRYGSPMPDWDQWDAEAAQLFIPWFEHNQFVQHLFHPHNEHRVILTKLQNLGLGILNGQWDSRLESVVNAMLHSALGAVFWVFACRWIGARSDGRDDAPHRPRAMRSIAPTLKSILFVITAALFGLPLAWQNILGGFHSQQYWLLGLSFAAIVTLPFAQRWSAAWWLGASSAVLAMGSMGSGFLAPAVVVVVIGWRIFRRDATWRDTWPTLLLAAILIAVGLLTRHEVAWHAKLKATSVRDFYFSIVHSLQWPLRERDWAAGVLWAPWVLVMWQVCRSGFIPDKSGVKPDLQWRSAQTIAALGGWVLVQVAATAYARGAGADYPASRYMDTLAFGAMVNAAALAWLLKGPRDQRTKGPKDPTPIGSPSPLVPWSLGPFVLLWLATLAWGLHEVCDRNLRYELPDAKKYYVKAEGVMARYLATNDPKQLASPNIPFPDAQTLIERLSHPSLRALMPVPIRAPLALAPADGAPGMFLENDARGSDPEHPPRLGLSPATPPLEASKSWGSFSAQGVATIGEWKSKPLESPLGAWLKFEIAGDLPPAGAPQIGLSLQDARSGDSLAEVRPTKMPGNTWRSAYVPAPRQPFVVTARDSSAQHWLAVGAPVEMGWLSYWAWRASKNGLLIVYISLVASVLLALAAALNQRHGADRA